jgi:hypothetical protein
VDRSEGTEVKVVCHLLERWRVTMLLDVAFDEIEDLLLAAR